MEPLILPERNLWAGFTGTRKGLTGQQAKGLLDLLVLLDPREVQHGDCVGADEKLHYMALGLGMAVVIRPPTDGKYRAFCQGGPTVKVREAPAKPYLDRNHDIVNHTMYLIACPDSKTMTVRSGTWATVRYAKANQRATYLVYPDGQLDRIEPTR